MSEKEDLVARLEKLGNSGPQHGYVTRDYRHIEIDRLLLDYIGDPDITRAVALSDPWYSSGRQQ